MIAAAHFVLLVTAVVSSLLIWTSIGSQGISCVLLPTAFADFSEFAAVAWAALHGEKLITAKDLYNYLSVHGVDVMSKTAHALHSPEKQQFHFFKHGAFLNYHSIDLKIDSINCYHSFAIR